MASGHHLLAAHQLQSAHDRRYLHDVGDDQGPLGAIPGSHKGELFDQYDAKNSG